MNGSEQMTESWGEIFYRTGALIAGLIAFLAALNSLYNLSLGRPIVPVAALGLAAATWLVGLCFRHIFGGSEID